MCQEFPDTEKEVETTKGEIIAEIEELNAHIRNGNYNITCAKRLTDEYFIFHFRYPEYGAVLTYKVLKNEFPELKKYFPNA